MVTMREVASHAGVSQKTVSRVFNDDPHVSPETRRTVQAALQELEYTPNSLAVSFRRGRAPVIGVAVPDIVDPFFASIARAIEDVARDNDMSTLVASLGDDPDREAGIVRSLIRRSPNGLVIGPVSDDQSHLREWVHKLPIVFVDRAPQGVVADSITDEDERGARIAIDHLLDHGHRRIAFIGDRVTLPTTSGRLDGYCQGLRAWGIEPVHDLVSLGVTNVRNADETLATLMSRPEPPTAVFSSNARVSMLLIPSIRQHAVGMISFGDFPMADVLDPPVTVIDQDPARMGALAAQRIIDRLAGRSTRARHINVLGVGLVERDSCRVGLPT